MTTNISLDWLRKQWLAWQATLPKQPLHLTPSRSSWWPKSRSTIAKSTNAHGTAFVQTDVHHYFSTDSAKPCYEAMIHSTSHTKSVWELVTIRTGEFKGHQAWVLIPCPDFIFPFFELPPELRQMVYKELFVRDGFDVMIYQPRQRNSSNFEGPGGCRPVFVKGDECTPSSYQLRVSTCSSKPPDYVDISPVLLTSRQVYREAGAVLFGCNKFRFPNLPVLRCFLEQIGEWRSYIRSIHCEANHSELRNWVSRIPETIDYLSVAPLTHLKLDLDANRFSKRNCNKLAAAWAPLFAALYEQDKDLARVDKIVTFYNTGVCKDHKRWATDTCRDECSAELCRNVKQALLDRLEPPPKIKRARKPRHAAKS
ncbi:hypothetical protein BDV97DRAFT_399460 [Delphinella strobiligena]|nr:hypothetical protein BDV97DRAFT_399460 [Delphinella strobiligena]